MAGTSLCVAGGLMLSFAGGRYAQGAVKADAARTAWDEAQAKSAVALARSEGVRGTRLGPVVNGAPVARIEIPRLGLDAIVLEGVGDDELNASPGHLPGSAFPGERGNAVISAHRDRHFNRLDGLVVGDTIITEAGTVRSVWMVTARRVIAKNDPALFHTKDPTLTLTTCWPIRYLGSAPDRLIVMAKLVPGRGEAVGGAKG
jgi:LPXTG-site transpeptidase (sortase) family protein